MYGSWTENEVLWKKFLGLIWDVRFIKGFPTKLSFNEIRKNERTRNSFSFIQMFREFRCTFDEIFDRIFAKIWSIFAKFLFDKNLFFSLSRQEDFWRSVWWGPTPRVDGSHIFLLFYKKGTTNKYFQNNDNFLRN